MALALLGLLACHPVNTDGSAADADADADAGAGADARRLARQCEHGGAPFRRLGFAAARRVLRGVAQHVVRQAERRQLLRSIRKRKRIRVTFDFHSGAHQRGSYVLESIGIGRHVTQREHYP